MSSAIDLGPALTQIGIGVLIAAPAWLTSRVLWQKSEKQSSEILHLREEWRSEVAQLRGDQILREREFSDKAIPVLGKCVEVLTSVARATEEEAMTRRIRDQIANEK